jgi:sugar (pentulose or hexulose) kinase
MFLPHLNGAGTPTCDPLSSGAIIGLTLATTRGDVAKAILECLSFELALNIEALSAAGVRIETISAVGGGALSAVWLQIKADVLGVPIQTLRCKESACLGAAILAGFGTGVYSSIAEGVRRAVAVDKVFAPDPHRSKAYADRLSLYRGLHSALRPFHQSLRGSP